MTSGTPRRVGLAAPPGPRRLVALMVAGVALVALGAVLVTSNWPPFGYPDCAATVIAPGGSDGQSAWCGRERADGLAFAAGCLLTATGALVALAARPRRHGPGDAEPGSETGSGIGGDDLVRR